MVDAQIHCVIDNGSGFIKAGFSGEEAPRFFFPNIVGRTKVEGVYVGNEKKESIIGTEAEQKFGILNITYPIQGGKITNWEEIEKIWHHTFFSELKIAPEEHNILLSESPFVSREDREKTLEIMFEIFNTPCIYLSAQSVLSAIAYGKSTGISVDCGEETTNFAPIYEGFLCREAVTYIPIAGRHIHETLVNLLIQNGQVLQSKMQKEAMKKAKIEFCYVSKDIENENNDSVDEYILPDKRIIKIRDEKYKAPELLFNPKTYGYDCNSMQDQFMISINKTDMDLRKDMFSNILFNGGTTLFKGFKERVDKEFKEVSKEYECKKKIHCYPEAQFAAWIGGSILSSLNTFENLWITKSEYKEVGSCIVHRKCP